MSRRGAAVVGLVAFSCLSPSKGRTKCEEASHAIGQLQALASTYEISHGRWPGAISDLVRDGLLEESVDPWGRSYRYELNSSKPSIWSEGPSDGTSDDDIKADTECPSSAGGCAFSE